MKTGYFTIRNLSSKDTDAMLEKEKRAVEEELRSKEYPANGYDAFFKGFGKTYPIRFQVKSAIAKGIPTRSPVLDAMFMAELKNGILTAGHDMDKIEGPLSTDIVREVEMSYVNISGKEMALKQGDIFTRDNAGVISSVLFGPDLRTRITQDTKNYLFFAYAFDKNIDLKEHFTDIVKYCRLFADFEVSGLL